ncbi:MAG TPA: valine--tRNA ligase [Gemmatimonadaceae bacterium]|nr:valine--tRNA ligase [Gemmatimonadaceae bacterium]
MPEPTRNGDQSDIALDPASDPGLPAGQLPAQYDPAATEPAIYARWLQAGCFTADASRVRPPSERANADASDSDERDPYTLVMPPPNVTAILHVGHGLNNTVQDVLVRWGRMKGRETLWVPGTDHAGIATQNIIEKQLAKEGLTRQDVGREAFVTRTREFVSETGGVILQQLQAIGCSADWSRTAYTFSPELSTAVREAFVRLYERGLIYRGHRVIHWCPRCLTSLSDEEAEPTETTGALYHLSYPIVEAELPAGETRRALSVATTRPETMLGDVAVAVNPNDERYQGLIGKHVLLPILNIPIPIVADDYADPEFGTGVVKITPAHDANDFEVGRRHALAMPVVIDEHGILREVADADGRVPGELRGLERFAARERIVEMLQSLGRLEHKEVHQHNVRRCYRCDTVVEPRLSDQWFVRMAPLAEPALEGVRSGRIRLLPEKWIGVYEHWMSNIRDWNISRQLWWGHRVPVWYCRDCDPPQDVIVSREDPTECPHCGSPVTQDEDVLDTWFSSWLWPISTLGWPNEQSTDLRRFYPTDVLVTAPEILFFWVARMIMSGYAFMGDAPFHSVYLHGTARDTQGRKMSKSLGNGIDPLDVVRLYGADALRWTLVSGMGLGADVMLDPADLEKSFATGRNFATKLWNIGRFLLTNVGGDPVLPIDALDPRTLARADVWILDRLDVAIRESDRAIGPLAPARDVWRREELGAGLRLNEYAETARRFVWNELADWYLEAIKTRLLTPGDDQQVARAVLAHVFDQALRLLHPIVPFVTEALWQRLPGHVDGTFLTTADWPVARPDAASSPIVGEFDLLRDVVEAMRRVRSEYGVAPNKSVDAFVVASPASRLMLGEESALIARLAKTTLAFVESAPSGAAANVIIPGGTELIVPLEGLIDVGKECARLRTELAGLEKQLTALEGRLANPGFLERAPANVVDSERVKADEWRARRDVMRSRIEGLCGAA